MRRVSEVATVAAVVCAGWVALWWGPRREFQLQLWEFDQRLKWQIFLANTRLYLEGKTDLRPEPPKTQSFDEWRKG